MVSNTRLNIREVVKEVELQKLAFFTPAIFAKTFNINLSRATIFLSRNTRLGYFVRIKKGIYSPTNIRPSPFEIANIVYKPSYISLELALSFYHIIPETVYSITSITTKHSKEIEIFNQIFTYRKLDRNLYFGYEIIRISNKNIVIATKEKALLDYLYFIARGQKKYNERIDLRTLNKQKLLKYSRVFFKNIKNKYIKKRFALLIEKINLS